MTWRHTILSALALLVSVLHGNTITYFEKWSPWEATIKEADFVGVVECDIAGPLISKYRVIEIWKGDPKLKSVLAYNPSQRFDQRVDSPICGLKAVVAWSKSTKTWDQGLDDPKVSIFSQRWKIPSDFELGSSSGFHTLASGNGDAKHFSNSEIEEIFRKGTLNDIRSRSVTFLTLSEEKQTIGCVLSSLQYSIDEFKNIREQDEEQRKHLSVLKQVSSKLKRAKTLDEFLKIFITNVDDPKESDFKRALLFGGKNLSKALESQREPTPPKWRLFIDDLKENAPDTENREKLASTAPTQPSTAQLNEANNAWTNQNVTDSDALSSKSAFKLLAVHRPESIVNKLIQLEYPTNTDLIVKELESYQLIRYFGMNCNTNRKYCLEQLLNAKDPIIRTGAAVYLCSEDLDQGMKVLEESSKLPGLAGSWAAITLVCRGQKSAITTALRVFAHKPSYYNAQVQSFWDKPAQLKALLSNSAKASGVPQPTAPYDVWWEKYGDKITLHDPWLAEMDRLKID